LPVYRFEELEGRRILITGEAGSGKTALTAQLLLQAMDRLGSGRVTVIDMAPSRRAVGGVQLGGTILIRTGRLRGVRYLRPRRVWAPRLEAEEEREVIRYSRRNAKAIEPLLATFLKAPTPALFINDLTIYLHAGSVDRLLEAIRGAQTFIGNAYEGRLLADDLGSGISRRERELLAKVKGEMDLLISL
jgi:GTPase SAR1 family protein